MLAVSASMPNRKVSIWMYVKIDGRWRYANQRTQQRNAMSSI
jgi:hypothetical protein